MDITFVPTTADASADVIGVAAGSDRTWLGDGASLVAALGEAFERLLDEAEFTGKSGQIVSYHTGALMPHTVIALGVGDDPDSEAFRQAGGALGRAAKKSKSVATTMHPGGALTAMIEGVLLSQYTFSRYLSEPKDAQTESLVIVGPDDQDSVARARVTTAATIVARDLINTPAADKAPTVIERHGRTSLATNRAFASSSTTKLP